MSKLTRVSGVLFLSFTIASSITDERGCDGPPAPAPRTAEQVARGMPENKIPDTDPPEQKPAPAQQDSNATK